MTIVTHAEYKEWIEGWGIRHRTAGGDPGALMKLSVEHKVRFSLRAASSCGSFLRIDVFASILQGEPGKLPTLVR